jgi:hypothetical protein
VRKGSERGQLVGRAALWVLPGELEDRAALTVKRILPNVADFDRREERVAVRFGV